MRRLAGLRSTVESFQGVVLAGLVPATHAAEASPQRLCLWVGVDDRNKSGQDARRGPASTGSLHALRTAARNGPRGSHRVCFRARARRQPSRLRGLTLS